MATTGELRAIIEELQLIDAGDAASYLGEEPYTADESLLMNRQDGWPGTQVVFYGDHLTSSCENASLS